MSSSNVMKHQDSKSSLSKMSPGGQTGNAGAAAGTTQPAGQGRASMSSQRSVRSWSAPANALATGETWLGSENLRGWVKRPSGRGKNTEVYYNHKIMQYKPEGSHQLMRIDGRMWGAIKQEQIGQDYAPPGTVHRYKWVIREETGAPTYIYRKYLTGTKKEDMLPPLSRSPFRLIAHAVGI